MDTCYACHRNIGPEDTHLYMGKKFCGHCWRGAERHAAEFGLTIKGS